MKYASTVIAVQDIKKSREFYEGLFGLEVVQDYGINISFSCGIALQQEFDWLIGVHKNEIKDKPNNMELCFEEKDFDRFLEKLEGYPEIELRGDVFEHDWGQRVIRFYDPDGHIIEVGEDMKLVVNRFLCSGMTMEETSKRMDVSVFDLKNLLSED